MRVVGLPVLTMRIALSVSGLSLSSALGNSAMQIKLSWEDAFLVAEQTFLLDTGLHCWDHSSEGPFRRTRRKRRCPRMPSPLRCGLSGWR